jgi:hypothetical protein
MISHDDYALAAHQQITSLAKEVNSIKPTRNVTKNPILTEELARNKATIHNIMLGAPKPHQLPQDNKSPVNVSKNMSQNVSYSQKLSSPNNHSMISQDNSKILSIGGTVSYNQKGSLNGFVS